MLGRRLLWRSKTKSEPFRPYVAGVVSEEPPKDHQKALCDTGSH